MDNINDTVGDGVQNSILTANKSIILLEIDLDFGSKNASSRRDAASNIVGPERGQLLGVTVFFENVSKRNITLPKLKTNFETENKFPDKVGELSDTHFDRQAQTRQNSLLAIHGICLVKESALLLHEGSLLGKN